MLYRTVKVWVRFSLPFFCRKISIHNKKGLAVKGPLILAVNHPNSFFDAILLGACMKHPVYFVTRGDVFEKPWIRKILESLKMIPIFRLRDGKNKLALNQQTFEATQKVLENNGTVLVFVEGFCCYQTELQLPLKKGAPRMLVDCWAKNIDAKFLPVWLRYDSFHDFGKIIDINLGEVFSKKLFGENQSDAQLMTQINKATETQLLALSALPKAYEANKKSWKLLIWPFAMLAVLLNAPFYFPIKNYIVKAIKGNEQYDSILACSLIGLYPFYLLLLSFFLYLITKNGFSFLLIVVLVVLNRLYLIWKK